jgi:hypothetical protein
MIPPQRTKGSISYCIFFFQLKFYMHQLRQIKKVPNNANISRATAAEDLGEPYPFFLGCNTAAVYNLFHAICFLLS